MLRVLQTALMGPELAVARDEVRGELDNLRAAVEWTLAEDDEHVALRVLEAFYTFLWMHSWFEGGETLERLLGSAGVAAARPGPGGAARALDAFYTFLWLHSWFEGGETLERLVRSAGFDADDPGRARAVALAAAMYRLAIGARLGYDAEAEKLGSRCLPVLRMRNLERELACCLCAMGIMAGYRDDLPEAVGLLEEGTKIAKAIDDGLTESGGLMDLGFGRLLLDELEAASEAFEASYALSAKLGNPLVLAYATSKLGLLADAEER